MTMKVEVAAQVPLETLIKLYMETETDHMGVAQQLGITDRRERTPSNTETKVKVIVQTEMRRLSGRRTAE